MLFFARIPYYEAHITIEPVFDERLAYFDILCKIHKFKAADLLMKKRVADTATRSQYDTFCTGRGYRKRELIKRTKELVESLLAHGYKVYRYKIEATLVDSNIKNDFDIALTDKS